MLDPDGIQESTSAAAKVKLDPLKYKWYVYDGRPAQFKVSDEFDFELKKGEIFGLKKVKGTYFLLDGSYLYVQFKLKEADAKRILNNSKSYSGKVGRVSVQPGTEAGKDRKRLIVDDLVEVRCDSSMLQEMWYDKKNKILYVKFPNGAEWKYMGVTAEEVAALEKAKSQGRYFNENIKAVKDAERFEHDSGNHHAEPSTKTTNKGTAKQKIHISVSKVLHEDMEHLNLIRLDYRQQLLINYLRKNKIPFDVEEGSYDEPFHVILNKKGDSSVVLENNIDGGWEIYKVSGKSKKLVAKRQLLDNDFIDQAINTK